MVPNAVTRSRKNCGLKQPRDTARGMAPAATAARKNLIGDLFWENKAAFKEVEG